MTRLPVLRSTAVAAEPETVPVTLVVQRTRPLASDRMRLEELVSVSDGGAEEVPLVAVAGLPLSDSMR